MYFWGIRRERVWENRKLKKIVSIMFLYFYWAKQTPCRKWMLKCTFGKQKCSVEVVYIFEGRNFLILVSVMLSAFNFLLKIISRSCPALSCWPGCNITSIFYHIQCIQYKEITHQLQNATFTNLSSSWLFETFLCVTINSKSYYARC